MKRKLDANDVPSPEGAETIAETQTQTPEVKDADFETLNLDPRLRQALIKEKFTKPTLVQAKAIPLALAGKDILGEFYFNFSLSYSIKLTMNQPGQRPAPARPLPTSSPSSRLSFRRKL